ncbi:hypothetical protein PUR34_18730 [Streptomyces sp. JV185]|uniref:hypothetical protein n=1 Tax=Streptomyces sp. JV185 TaxID=858638 RepID=UPI002E768403|nr:hypothetical protein [Streptomyces sp. JV185]MEE1770124.1 hypothetical protein [Streptomyces sp. JV185]
MSAMRRSSLEARADPVGRHLQHQVLADAEPSPTPTGAASSGTSSAERMKLHTAGRMDPQVMDWSSTEAPSGSGTAWTAAQGPLEAELADALGMPHDEVMLAAFIPLAFTIGTDFKPAGRIPREQVLRWDRW